MLCAYGITTTGAPVFLGLDSASAESTDACLGFLQDLTGRGLRPPLQRFVRKAMSGAS